MNVSVLSSRGQIVIPKEIRDRLKIKPGDKVILNIVENHAEIEPVPKDPIESLCGILADYPKSLAGELLKERRKEKRDENR